MNTFGFNEFPVDLDAPIQLWVLEVKYTGGGLQRLIIQDEAEALKRYRFVRDRASTDWQRLYGVTLNPLWTRFHAPEDIT